MEELMKSFGLFADEDGYWFVTKEDHVRGNFLVITILIIIIIILNMLLSTLIK